MKRSEGEARSEASRSEAIDEAREFRLGGPREDLGSGINQTKKQGGIFLVFLSY